MNDYSDLFAKIREVEIIHESEADGEFKYRQIFSMWREEIKPLMDSYGFKFDWYDPDTTYEDDIRAFANALMEFRDQLRKNLDAVEESRRRFDENP